MSSVWVKERAPKLREFAWRSGHGAFSVSASDVERVHAYITRQEEHHRKRSFQDEYRVLLQKYGLEWDERYVWD